MAVEIGYQLREARLRNGLSLREASLNTGINIRYLQSIERGQWQHLPNTINYRNLIRSYARFLGVNTSLYAVTTEMRRIDDHLLQAVPSYTGIGKNSLISNTRRMPSLQSNSEIKWMDKSLSRKSRTINEKPTKAVYTWFISIGAITLFIAASYVIWVRITS